jgi:hypothetical protein
VSLRCANLHFKPSAERFLELVQEGHPAPEIAHSRVGPVAVDAIEESQKKAVIRSLSARLHSHWLVTVESSTSQITYKFVLDFFPRSENCLLRNSINHSSKSELYLSKWPAGNHIY